mgnify:CR=1 FL=1
MVGTNVASPITKRSIVKGMLANEAPIRVHCFRKQLDDNETEKTIRSYLQNRNKLQMSKVAVNTLWVYIESVLRVAISQAVKQSVLKNMKTVDAATMFDVLSNSNAVYRTDVTPVFPGEKVVTELLEGGWIDTATKWNETEVQ